MAVKIEKFTISTKGFDDLIDITTKVQNAVSNIGTKNGIANISMIGSTASIITMENEPGLALDLPKILQDIVPINQIYQHDNVWHDGNAFAHLKAVMLGGNLTLPVVDGIVALDTWQQIILIDFDNKPSTRQIIVSVVD